MSNRGTRGRLSVGDVLSLVATIVVLGAAYVWDAAGRVTDLTGPIPDTTAKVMAGLLVAMVAITLAFVAERRRTDQTRQEIHEALERSQLDSLTGIPNRAALHDRLTGVLAGGTSPSRQTAVLFIDLDRFKAVNDIYGHPFGDQLLGEVATRLTQVVRDGDLLVRFGGDEFVMVADRLGGADDAEVIAERVAFALAHPFSVQSHTISLSASIGIAMVDPTSSSPEDLLRQADTAMYGAKAKGRSCHVVYKRAMGRTRDRHSQLWERVEKAWQQELLYVVYQPIYGIESGEVEGAEALLRWDDPEQGPISPAEFVPVLEQSGRIVEVGAWVLHEACRQTARWRDTYGVPDFTVNVNISGAQVKQADFAETVEATLAASNLDPSMLCLEITEVMLLQDLAAAWDSLRPLAGSGVKIALDDFGTGYSSLSHLRNFALDHLKIDRSFVKGVGLSPEDTEIVAAVISMAGALGVSSVAEGVETRDQLRWLTRMGCQQGQGYLWSKPRPPEGLEALLRRQKLEAAARA